MYPMDFHPQNSFISKEMLHDMTAVIYYILKASGLFKADKPVKLITVSGDREHVSLHTICCFISIVH